MSVIEYKMKTHSRENITDQFDLNNCVVHGRKPTIFKIVSGRRKGVYYIANCHSDDCGKITSEPNEIGAIWNKWNPAP